MVFPTKLSSIQKELISMALRFPPELTDENHIQRRVSETLIAVLVALIPSGLLSVEA